LFQATFRLHAKCGRAEFTQPSLAAEAQGWNLHSQVSVLLGFIDGLIAADPGIAGRLRAHLAAVSATESDLHCRECGEPVFLTETGISHHAGGGMCAPTK